MNRFYDSIKFSIHLVIPESQHVIPLGFEFSIASRVVF